MRAIKRLLVISIFLAEVQILVGGNKIVGGYETRPHHAPYTAHLDRTYNNAYFCAGVLINNLWVLSAAHCGSGFSLSDFTVTLGDHDLDDNEGTEQVFNPVLAIQHHLYNSDITDYDIMMIKLDRPAIINQYVQIAEMPSSAIGSNVECQVCGWGYTDYVGTTLPPRLHCVEVDTVSNIECNSMYGGEIRQSMLCAGGDGKDACNGDSGGPLTCNGVLHGITSTGFGCAYPEFPGIYARVTEFRSWIDLVMSYN